MQRLQKAVAYWRARAGQSAEELVEIEDEAATGRPGSDSPADVV